MHIRRLLPSITILASIATFQIAAHIATAQILTPEQSELSAAATSHFDISGNWIFISGDVAGRMTLRQEPSSLPCKRFTGFMDFDIDDSNVIGVYCPSSLLIYFGRYKMGESTPFQMHEGYVNNGTGKYMAGSFFSWGNDGPGRFSGTNVFIGERRQ